jgi:hypothetical protein
MMRMTDTQARARALQYRWPQGRYLRGEELNRKLDELASIVAEFEYSAICYDEGEGTKDAVAAQLGALSEHVEALAFKLQLVATEVAKGGGGGWLV